MTVCCTSACTMGYKLHMIVFIISSGRGAQSRCLLVERGLMLPSMLQLCATKAKQAECQYLASRGQFVRMHIHEIGFVEIDRNESQTLKSNLFKLASPQEKKKQVAQAATWVGYGSYGAGYISDARFKPCVVFYMSRFWAISVLNDNIILKTVVWILF